MHGVLNVDEIKNWLHSFVVLCETNILSLVSQNLHNFYQIQTKCYRNYDTVFFFPIRRTKRGPSLDLEICKVAIISCKNKHGTRSAGSRPRLASCNTTQAYTGYTLDTRATPPHDPSMHCAYFFQKPFRHRKLVTPRDELQNLLIHILLVAWNCFPRSYFVCLYVQITRPETWYTNFCTVSYNRIYQQNEPY
jgi:hypothetical protein